MLLSIPSIVVLFHLANTVVSTPVEAQKPPIDLAAISNGILSNEFVTKETDNKPLVRKDLDERHTKALLLPRLSIEQKCGIIQTGLASVVTVAAIPSIVRGLTDLIKYLSDIGSCEEQGGGIPGTGINFEYQASGRNCDTTSERKTIEAAVQGCVERMRSAHATQMCCEFTHGGTWTGHMQVTADFKTPIP
ncbi:MAG: hypothetical protein Q9169_007641, partial [Polycauliona sp. 2 TL-2023]